MAQKTSNKTSPKKASPTGTGCFRILIGPPTEPGALEALLEKTVSGQPDRKVLVIEADPDRAAVLETQLPKAQIMAGVVGTQKGEVELVQYNFPGLAGITPPLPALSELLPGLRVVEQKQTAVIAMDKIVTWLGKRGAAGPLDLYIDAPGSEMVILDGLAKAGLLAVCARLHLRCGAEPMFEQAVGRDALVTRCSEDGFKLVQEETEDPDFPELVFEIDLVARALEEALNELTKLKRKSALESTQIAKLKEQQAETEAQLKKVTTAATAAEEKYAATVAKLESTTKAATAAEQNHAATVAKLESTTKAATAAEQKHAATAAKLADTTKAVTAAEQKQAAGQEQITTLTAQMVTLKEEVEEEQQNARQIRAALHKRNGEVEARSKAMEDARIAHEAAVSELDAQLEQLRGEMKTTRETDRKNIVQLRETLNKRNGALEAQGQELAALRAEFEAQADEMQVQAKALKSAKKKRDKSEAKLKAEGAALAEARTQIETLEKRVRTLEEAQQTSQQNLAQTRETLNKRNLALAERTEELKAARAEAATPDRDTATQLEQSKADLAVALRMQMLAQSDLRDLQARFREVSQARAAQQALLEKLTPRLQQAAEHMQHMQLIDAETGSDAPRLAATGARADILSDAVSEAKPKPKKTTRPSAKSKSKTSVKRVPRTSKTTKS